MTNTNEWERMVPINNEDDNVLESYLRSGAPSGNMIWCNANNYKECIGFMNSTLETFGYSAIGFPQYETESSVPLHSIAIVNTLYLLLNQRQQDLLDKEEYSLYTKRLTSEKEHWIIQQVKLDEKIVELQKEITFKSVKEKFGF